MSCHCSDYYPPFVHERFVPEKHKRGQRSDFERDRARILHSSALRRLASKTQVMGPLNDDFVRNRLTHSLEVAQVGRELGSALGCDPDVVDAACLAHDLGHPPFGHNGERILDQLATDIGGFEGNAQTLRLVSCLEPKVIDAAGRPAGLNLTRAALDAICKYPWPRGGNSQYPDSSKYGAYREDEAVFAWLRHDAPPLRRCLEAQVMDLSDDIAYSVHDVEDAIRTGATHLDLLRDDRQLAQVIDVTRAWYGSATSADALARAYERLVKMPFWLGSPADTFTTMAALKDCTSQLIGRFCLAAIESTRDRFGVGPLSRYAADLVVPAATREEIMLLKGIAVYYVMAPRETTHTHVAQIQVLADLVAVLLERRGKDLQPPFDTHFAQAADHPLSKAAGQLRAVIDQVASLTDISAHQWHSRLCGMFSQPT